jgi:hypothetical protein
LDEESDAISVGWHPAAFGVRKRQFKQQLADTSNLLGQLAIYDGGSV